MTRDEIAKALLKACSARLDAEDGPLGTAFFVAPGYAISAAHVVRGAVGLPVQLTDGQSRWHGHVVDARPPGSPEVLRTSPYPAPDLALMKIDRGPEHRCALLSTRPAVGGRMMTRGYTRTSDQAAVTAETEKFRLTGDLETSDPGCTLLKLGLGEVSAGMSGAPVIDLKTGDAIGMVRTSRQLRSNLGGWVVPAGLIRALWTDLSLANDRFHQDNSWWRDIAAQLDGRSQSGDARRAGKSGMSIHGEAVSVITGGNVGEVTIINRPAGDSRTS
jgi:hypothetical protein